MTWTITLPWPDTILTPNARPHHMALHRAKKKARRDAFLICREAKVKQVDWAKVVLIETYHNPTGRVERDEDNAKGGLKAYRDGIADALGVDDKNFTSPYRIGEKRPGGAVVVQIMEHRGIAE